MLRESCRCSGRPGFVRTLDHAAVDNCGDERRGLIPCPECGGTGIAHCCDGTCEQPAAASDAAP